MPTDIAAASPLDDAQLTYRIRLEGMSEGGLQRERLRLKTKEPDGWQMTAWRREFARRSVPTFARG